MSKSSSKIILSLTGLEDRTNPANIADPYLPPPPPPPPVVVILVPIVQPPAMPNSLSPIYTAIA